MSPSDLAEEFSILYIYSPERMSDRPIFNEITYSYDDYESAYALRNFLIRIRGDGNIQSTAATLLLRDLKKNLT
jgi:hypothetical protein